MPYGTPTPSERGATQLASFQHTNGQQITLTRNPNAFGDPADHDEAFQAAVDALAASPNFTFVGGEKSYMTTEEITPTV